MKLQHLLLLSPIICLTTFIHSSLAIAQETTFNPKTNSSFIQKPFEISQNITDTASFTDQSSIANLQSENSTALDQVTSVTQLSDVQPTDWAYQALKSLVERYGCIVGYPDKTYRGNRALSRWEFAAGLNACLDKIQELIAAATADFVRKEDLETLKQLQEQFAAELATLRGRVDALEVRTATLEKQQFSTTTKLSGETVFGLISVLAGDRADGTKADRVPTFGYRVRLNLESSFTGRDLLTARLQASNVVPLGSTNKFGRGIGVTGTNEGRIEFDGDSRNSVSLSLLRYRFPIGSRTNVYIAGTGNGFVDVDASQQLNPYFDGGAVSLFGLRNPIYNYSYGTGIGFRHFFNDVLELNLAYLTPVANDPTAKNGLFNGQYAGLAQVIFNLSPSSRIGFTYINAYNPFPASLRDIGEIGSSFPIVDAFSLLATGSNLANSTFGRAVNINAYGFSGTISFNPHVALSGWVGYSNHRYIGLGDGQVWNWLVGLAFPDIGHKGNLGGLMVGMEPKLTGISNNINGGQSDRDTSFHVEAFYRFRVTDNIAVTPGLIWITAPNFDARNDDLFIGVVRTVFYF